MIEEMLVVVVLLLISVSSKKWSLTNKVVTDKEIHSPKSCPTQTTQFFTSQASKGERAESYGEADLFEIQHASSASGSYTLKLRELARARDLAGVEQLVHTEAPRVG